MDSYVCRAFAAVVCVFRALLDDRLRISTENDRCEKMRMVGHSYSLRLVSLLETFLRTDPAFLQLSFPKVPPLRPSTSTLPMKLGFN